MSRKSRELTDELVQEADATTSVDEPGSGADVDESAARPHKKPHGKGRPTPKRRESERRRGPIAAPPMTQREAYRRAKEANGGHKLTKEQRRELSLERRERMMSGDDAYLLPRDRGEVRAYVRDLVDSRRNLAGLLLPIAMLSFLTLVIPSPIIADLGPLILMVMILAGVADSIIFGRRMSRKVAIKFPNGDKSGLSTRGSSLGFYAFNRACLIRKWRIPRPRVERGAVID